MYNMCTKQNHTMFRTLSPYKKKPGFSVTKLRFKELRLCQFSGFCLLILQRSSETQPAMEKSSETASPSVALLLLFPLTVTLLIDRKCILGYSQVHTSVYH